MRMLPPSPKDIYETTEMYWSDIVDVISEINRDGNVFYSKNFGLIHFEERTIRLEEEAPQSILNYSTTIAKFYNERYKLVMRYGDSTTPLSGDLYLFFKNQDGNNKRVGYLKCDRGIITMREMEPVDVSGEIIFKSLWLALPGPLSFLIHKVNEVEVDVLRLHHKGRR